MVHFENLLVGGEYRQAHGALLEDASKSLFAFQQPLLGLAAICDFTLEQPVARCQFGRSLGHAMFEQIVCILEFLFHLIAAFHLPPQTTR